MSHLPLPVPCAEILMFGKDPPVPGHPRTAGSWEKAESMAPSRLQAPLSLRPENFRQRSETRPREASLQRPARLLSPPGLPPGLGAQTPSPSTALCPPQETREKQTKTLSSSSLKEKVLECRLHQRGQAKLRSSNNKTGSVWLWHGRGLVLVPPGCPVQAVRGRDSAHLRHLGKQV